MRRVFSKLIISAVAIISVSCIYDDPELEFELKVGDRIPDFTVQMNDGTTVTGKSLRDGVSVIVFFHTECPDCKETLPSVQRVYDEYLAKGVSFALISRSQVGAEIAEYWKETGYTMPYSGQTDRTVYNLFATTRVPRVYICKDGRIKSFYTDNPNVTYEELKADIESCAIQ